MNDASCQILTRKFQNMIEVIGAALMSLAAVQEGSDTGKKHTLPEIVCLEKSDPGPLDCQTDCWEREFDDE